MRFDVSESAALDPQECLALLKSVSLGRVVFTDRALPAIQPIDFVLDGQDVIVSMSPGSRLSQVLRGSIVAFEADHVDPQDGSAWTVTVIGKAHLVDRPREITRLSNEHRTSRPGDVFARIPSSYVCGQRAIPDSR